MLIPMVPPISNGSPRILLYGNGGKLYTSKSGQRWINRSSSSVPSAIYNTPPKLSKITKIGTTGYFISDNGLYSTTDFLTYTQVNILSISGDGNNNTTFYNASLFSIGNFLYVLGNIFNGMSSSTKNLWRSNTGGTTWTSPDNYNGDNIQGNAFENFIEGANGYFIPYQANFAGGAPDGGYWYLPKNSNNVIRRNNIIFPGTPEYANAVFPSANGIYKSGYFFIPAGSEFYYIQESSISATEDRLFPKLPSSYFPGRGSGQFMMSNFAVNSSGTVVLAGLGDNGYLRIWHTNNPFAAFSEATIPPETYCDNTFTITITSTKNNGFVLAMNSTSIGVTKILYSSNGIQWSLSSIPDISQIDTCSQLYLNPLL